ncbi:hypothetical protein Tco_1404621 [Tanacetum coccineum]
MDWVMCSDTIVVSCGRRLDLRYDGITLDSVTPVSSIYREILEQCWCRAIETDLRLYATKKTQKNLLKQQYENFAASSTEVIEETYERL